MTIALPVSQERISPLLDAATRLLVIRWRQGREVGRQVVIIAPQSTEALAQSVAGLRVDLLLCAAVSEPLRRELVRHGVQVRPHLCGEVNAILQAFGRKCLHRPEFRMPGCWERHLAHRRCGRSTVKHALKFTSSPPQPRPLSAL